MHVCTHLSTHTCTHLSGTCDFCAIDDEGSREQRLILECLEPK